MGGFGLSHNFNNVRQIFIDIQYIRISGWCISNFYRTLTYIFMQAKYVKSSSAIYILNYFKNHEVKL